MAEMLLINPGHRPKKRKTKRASPAQRAARAKFAAMARARRKNPAKSVAARRRRRSNPILSAVRSRTRRRSNPIKLGGMMGGYMTMIQAAFVQGAGAVAFDVAHGQIARFLPDSLKRTPGSVGVGDAVKAVITAALGKLLAKPTRGLSLKAAQGSLTVQAHGIIASMVPATLTLGYAAPGRVIQGNSRVGPNVRSGYVGAYTPPGATPMLNAYTRPGATQLLSGSRGSALAREGVTNFR